MLAAGDARADVGIDHAFGTAVGGVLSTAGSLSLPSEGCNDLVDILLNHHSIRFGIYQVYARCPSPLPRSCVAMTEVDIIPQPPSRRTFTPRHSLVLKYWQ